MTVERREKQVKELEPDTVDGLLKGIESYNNNNNNDNNNNNNDNNNNNNNSNNNNNNKSVISLHLISQVISSLSPLLQETNQSCQLNNIAAVSLIGSDPYCIFLFQQQKGFQTLI